MNRYEALQHAVRAHNQDTDWGGQLYVLHPMAVAGRIEAHWGALPLEIQNRAGGVESGIVVALLHDVLEDTKYMIDPDDLTAAQWMGLNLVTRSPGETYFDYVGRIAANAKAPYGVDPLAAIVKLADLSHNMSAERKVGLTDVQLSAAAGLEKARYIPSRDMLWEALRCEWWPES